MSVLLDNTYEILQQIGAGGGGLVYLGRHKRLDKLVVLKEDKRSVHTPEASLRREVDSLKNLSHQYIPQVYDFFVENDKTYTVMDYIDGKSFDVILKSGETFTQAQVVKWSKQLLESLHYLHTQKPKGILHADIKPANIMLTPHGDIRLIDFNIALVLGADGAVAVGRSFGYASPEHYGFRVNSNRKSSRARKNSQLPSVTQTSRSTAIDVTEPQSPGQNQPNPYQPSRMAQPSPMAQSPGAVDYDKTDLASPYTESTEWGTGRGDETEPVQMPGYPTNPQGGARDETEAVQMSGYPMNPQGGASDETEAVQLPGYPVNPQGGARDETEAVQMPGYQGNQPGYQQGDETEPANSHPGQGRAGYVPPNPPRGQAPGSRLGRVQENKVPIFQGYSYSTSESGQIMLDARSDIYSLGATLYHLLTGERPSKDAPNVTPLSPKKFSKSVIAIIEKSMHPDPDLRYQTADEMLKDLQNLRKNDHRTKRLHRIAVLAGLVCASGFAVGAYATNIGLTRQEATQASLVQAEYSANALAEGNVSLALQYALDALPEPDGLYVPDYTAQGQYALSQALRLYQFDDGYHVARNLNLNSEILGLALSDDGKTALVLNLGTLYVIEVETSHILAELPTEYSALSEFFFVDNETIFYAGESGVVLFDLTSLSPLWTGQPGTRLAMSQDKTHFASLFKDHSRAFVYDRSGNQVKEVVFEGFSQRVASSDLFANPHDNVFALNANGTYLTLSFEGGGLMMYDCTPSGMDAGGDIEFFSTSHYTEASGGYYDDYFAFSMTAPNESLFAIFDCRDFTQTGGFVLSSKIGVTTDETGIYLNTENVVVGIHPVTGEQTEIAYTGDSDVVAFDLSQDGHSLVLTEDFGYSFYDPLTNLIEKKMEGDDGFRYGAISDDSALMGSLDSNLLKILSLQNYPDQQFAFYDSYFPHLEARVSQDQSTITLYNLEEVRVYNLEGTLVGSSIFPTEEHIYDQQFLRELNRLEVIYYDGTRGYYSAQDGSFLEEVQGDVPSSDNVASHMMGVLLLL